MAMIEVTGISPYVVQRWYATGDDLEDVERGEMRILDTQGMLGGKP